jgi:hypothetical protein
MTGSIASETKTEVTERTSFVMRMARAALLHADTYEEIEADRSSIGQATCVVILACFAAALGFWLRIEAGASVLVDSRPLYFQVAIVGLEPLVIWVGASAFSYMTGASFFRGPETETDFFEVLRTTGFAFTPAMLAAFSFVPPATVGLAILALARLWSLVATVVAVRQALDFTTLRAIGTFGSAVLMLWLVLWGLSVAPSPF